MELPVVRERKSDLDNIETRIKVALKKHLFQPIVEELEFSQKTIFQNELIKSPTALAIAKGFVTHHQGVFKGRFTSEISKELRGYGAKWDKYTQTYRLPLAEMPMELRSAISLSEARFSDKLKKIDKKLEELSPAEIAGSVKTADIFDSSIFRLRRDINATTQGIITTPTLTESQRQRLSTEWQENLQLYIKDFTKEQILKLRKEVAEAAFAGNRRDYLAKIIRANYGVTENKAKFLAHQESRLLMTKLKEVSYTEAGITKYKWRCVVGSPKHPVRPMHKKLDGKIFSWEHPPITSEDGRRNNPGQDFGCRCYAIPIL